MKIIITIVLLVFIQSCASTKQFYIYNPYPDRTLNLERKNVSCSDASEIKIWYVLYGSYQINTINTKEIFPSPDYSYKIEQISTGGDKFISLFTGLFFSVSRKTLQVETCLLVKKGSMPENEIEPAPQQSYYNESKLEKLEKEVAFLKGKISGIESTFSMVSSVPNYASDTKSDLSVNEIRNKPTSRSFENENSNKSTNIKIPVQNLTPASIFHSRFLFRINSYSLSSVEKQKLEKINIILNKSESRVLIVGYADKTGQFLTNLNLSWQRAIAVKKTLIGLGVDESRIQLSAAGETGELSSSKIAKLSRRVDLYLLEEKL